MSAVFWLGLATGTLLVVCVVFAWGILALRKERDELQATFDLQWEADRRGIRKWQALHPERNLTWPDRAKFVVWLIERLEAAEDLAERHKAAQNKVAVEAVTRVPGGFSILYDRVDHVDNMLVFSYKGVEMFRVQPSDFAASRLEGRAYMRLEQ